MSLPMLDVSYKWNHTICGLLCLASFTKHVFQVHHVVASISISFLVWLNYVPLYGHTTSSLFIHQLMGIWVSWAIVLLCCWAIVLLLCYWAIALLCQLCVRFCLSMCFNSFGYIPESGTAELFGKSHLNLLDNPTETFNQRKVMIRLHFRNPNVPNGYLGEFDPIEMIPRRSTKFSLLLACLPGLPISYPSCSSTFFVFLNLQVGMQSGAQIYAHPHTLWLYTIVWGFCARILLVQPICNSSDFLAS